VLAHARRIPALREAQHELFMDGGMVATLAGLAHAGVFRCDITGGDAGVGREASEGVDKDVAFHRLEARNLSLFL
jgi:hypothetical protein